MFVHVAFLKRTTDLLQGSVYRGSLIGNLGFLAVLGAYGAWGVANAIGCVVAMEAVRSRAWAGVFVWSGAAAAWNACLFCRRPPLRRAKVA